MCLPQPHGNCTTQPSPPTGLSGQLSEDCGAPAELGGQRLQVSQIPAGVSGEEGIRLIGDSQGVRDPSRRMEVASSHVSCLQMQPVKREKSPTIHRAGKMIKFYTSEATVICRSDGVGSVPSGY